MSLDSDSSFSIAEKDLFDGWRGYPSNVIVDHATVNLRSYRDGLSDIRPDLFCESSSQTDIGIIDVPRGGLLNKASQKRFQTSKAVENHILENQAYGTRIISLHSQTSLEPLKVTEECFRKILTHHDVGTVFLDAIFAFGGKPKDSDIGTAGMKVTHRPDGSYGKSSPNIFHQNADYMTIDLCYIMIYVEEKRGKARTSWPIRQTAVFHRHMPGSEGNLWILVHPMPDSVLQLRLEDSIDVGAQLLDDPSFQKLHLIAISSYIESSRWYLKALTDEYEEIADVALTLDFSRSEDYADGFKTLTQLQYLQERILPLTPRFETTAATVAELRRMNDIFQGEGFYGESLSRIMSNSLSLYASKFRGYNASAELLKSRVQGIIKLLSVSLGLKNQATSVDINHNILLLTKDTVDDSATVRVVTLVTLIYLPASFVCSLFGMNFFTFQTAGSSHFAISGQFWIFIALTVPLTILTVGSWFYISHKRRRNKALQERAQKQRRSGIEV